MRKKLTPLLKSATVRQSFITTTSTFVVAGLGAIFYLILARLVGPAEYGLFSLSLQIMGALSPLVDVGTGTVLVRFVGQHALSDEYKPYAALALRLKLSLGIICLLILWLFARPIAFNIVHKPEIAPLLPFAGLGILALVLYSFTISTLQGLQKFFVWGALPVAANLFRLIIVGLLFWFGALNSHTALLSFEISMLFVFVAGWIWLDKKIISTSPKRDIWSQFWQYGKWTAAFTIIASIVSRLDGFFTARYLDLSQTGIYALALTMGSFLPQLTSALGAVSSPKFANFTSREQTQTYLRKSLIFSACISLAVALAMIPVALGVIAFTGKSYAGSFIPFLIIIAGLCIFGATGPMRDSLLYAHKRPDIFVYVGLIQGVAVTACSILLIPKMGITGAALSSLISQIVLTICVVIAYKYINRHT